MGVVDDYLAGLEADDRALIERIYTVAAERLGESEQGMSYAMPALLHRGAPVIAVQRRKAFVAIYPFSGAVPERVAGVLGDVEHDKGTIRIRQGQTLTDDAVRAIVDARRAEIEDPAVRRAAR